VSPFKAPGHLSAEARRWWDRITAGWSLDDAGLLILQAALEAFDRLRQAQAVVAEDGVVVEDPSGRKRAHPALSIEKESRLALLRAWKQLNLEQAPAPPVG